MRLPSGEKCGWLSNAGPVKTGLASHSCNGNTVDVAQQFEDNRLAVRRDVESFIQVPSFVSKEMVRVVWSESGASFDLLWSTGGGAS